MDSTPPPTAICRPSVMISLAAVAIAISPEAHCRSTVMPGTADGQSGAQCGLAGGVVAGGALLHRAAEDDLLDLGAVEAGAVDRRGDGVGGELLALGVREGALVGLADGGTGGRDDHCFSHGSCFLCRCRSGSVEVGRGQSLSYMATDIVDVRPPSSGIVRPVR
jgi:hypothetical protein